MSEISTLLKVTSKNSLAPSAMKQKKSQSASQKWAFTRTQPRWHPDLKLPSLQNYKQYFSVVDKPLSL